MSPYRLVWQETLLPVEELLTGRVHLLLPAVLQRHLSAVLPAHLPAHLPALRHAGDSAPGLAGEGGHLLDAQDLLWLVIPQRLLLVPAADLGHNEGDLLGHELTLLPGDGLTGVSPRPLLVPLLVSFPESDAVLFRHIPALGQHLGVGDLLPPLAALLLLELLGN